MRPTLALLVLLAGVNSTPARAQVTGDAPYGKPAAVIDLGTAEGAALVQGQWRYSDAHFVAVEHHDPGPDLRPSGPPNRTNDLVPHAGVADFDDSTWPVVPAESIASRRGNGKFSFNWYRINVTIPERVGRLDPTGMTLVLEVVVDDYAEVWVDGKLPTVLGQTGGQLVKGFNAPNRVVLSRSAQPGQRFQLAIFGMNAPVSNPPVNFIWIRSATLDLYSPEESKVAREVESQITRADPAIDALVPRDAKLEKLAGGFQFVEGPVWVRDGGYLLFSDPNANTIYRWSPDGQVSVYRTKSGYAGVDIGEYHQPGSNGLTLDREGRLVIDQHGSRRVIRVERTGAVTVLADRYEGRRLNSPNDLVFRSDGSLYFTDPPFGLPRVFDDPKKETPWSGVYRLKDGKLTLLTKELSGPNGIAFSPDEKYLYVDNWDPKRKVIMRYEVSADGSISNGRVFYDITRTVPGDDAWDGLKVDQRGNLYAAGPAGVYVLSPEGKLLGTIGLPEHVANFNWGDEDGRSLYITASTGLYRIRLSIPGAGAWTDVASSRP
ncbi:MAG TPA: SMP-30/gluconolactonase/LRE family protein [Gemmatimonadales bacterium]|nr:SMP-30/gluconolactonase/LRE family protein [Gemmatimonadales bacterium]